MWEDKSKLEEDGPLATATADDILEELGKRFETVLLVMDGPGMNKKDLGWVTILYKGSLVAAIGTATVALENLKKAMEPVKGGPID